MFFFLARGVLAHRHRSCRCKERDHLQHNHPLFFATLPFFHIGIALKMLDGAVRGEGFVGDVSLICILFFGFVCHGYQWLAEA